MLTIRVLGCRVKENTLNVENVDLTAKMLATELTEERKAKDKAVVNADESKIKNAKLRYTDRKHRQAISRKNKQTIQLKAKVKTLMKQQTSMKVKHLQAKYIGFRQI